MHTIHHDSYAYDARSPGRIAGRGPERPGFQVEDRYRRAGIAGVGAPTTDRGAEVADGPRPARHRSPCQPTPLPAQMIVVDTSVWIAGFRSATSESARVLGTLLDEDEVALPIPVRIELLSGASPKDRARLRRLLSALPTLYPTDETWKLIEQWTIR